MKRRSVLAVAVAALFGPVIKAASVESLSGTQPLLAHPADQVIRIEPVDATHVRLVVEGGDPWIVDAGSFDIRPGDDSVWVVAKRGENVIHQRGGNRIVESFRLSVSRRGAGGVRITTRSPQ
jgi:hypothetical protein